MQNFKNQYLAKCLCNKALKIFDSLEVRQVCRNHRDFI